MNKTKQTTIKISSLLLALLCIVGLSACRANADPWKSAIYTEDTTFGTGAKIVQVEVQVNENRVTFTINTDKATLGEALIEHALIEGENAQYGLYVKKVNGILADFDKDQTYWGFYQNGEYLLTGVDSTAIVGGEHFEIVYSR